VSERATKQEESGVRAFLRTTRAEILSRWRARAAEIPVSSELTSVRLVDHVPELLDQLGEIAEELARDPTAKAGFETARNHALDRVADGFNLTEVIHELSLLRASIQECWSTEYDVTLLSALHLAIDRAIIVTVDRYAASARSEQFDQVASERERLLAKLESLLAASPIGIAFIDRDLRFIRINDALAEVNGSPAAQHIGRTVSEMLPAVASTLEPLLRGVIETGEPVLNLEIAKPGDTEADTRWFVATYFPVKNSAGNISGVGGIVLETTDMRRAQDALQHERSRLQSIVEHAPAAIWVKDAAGHVVLANHRLADALGHPLENIIGRRSSEILPPDLAAQHEEHDALVLREQRAVEVEEVAPAGAGVRTFLSIKFPIPGGPPLVGAIATEITDRKRIEEELRIAVRTREDLLAVVSHDLRNPLGALQLGASFLLAEYGHDHRTRRHIEVIQRSCARMEGLIDDLLDIANIRAGRFNVELRPQMAEDVLSEAMELQEQMAVEKGIKLVRQSDLDGIQMRCDRDRILQVFGNLIGNALKFCRAGDTITVEGKAEDEHVQFSIADTGPGIAPELVPHLFDPYFSSPEHAKHGSGLGLYIVRGIIESHHGSIHVDSTLGKGATFSFTLPIVR
jgi:PAS domain S-box-containing protein